MCQRQEPLFPVNADHHHDDDHDDECESSGRDEDERLDSCHGGPSSSSPVAVRGNPVVTYLPDRNRRKKCGKVRVQTAFHLGLPDVDETYAARWGMFPQNDVEEPRNYPESTLELSSALVRANAAHRGLRPRRCLGGSAIGVRTSAGRAASERSANACRRGTASFAGLLA